MGKEFIASRSVAIFNIKEGQQLLGILLFFSPLTVADQCSAFCCSFFKRNFYFKYNFNFLVLINKIWFN
jgi:hypothetical protein